MKVVYLLIHSVMKSILRTSTGNENLSAAKLLTFGFRLSVASGIKGYCKILVIRGLGGIIGV